MPPTTTEIVAIALAAAPPVPPMAWNVDDQPSNRPLVRVHRPRRRNRTDLSWVPVTLFATGALAAVFVFATHLVEQGDRQRPKELVRRHTAPRRSQPQPESPRAPVPADPAAAVVGTVTNQAGPSTGADEQLPHPTPPVPETPTDTRGPATSRWVADALEACREGRYEDAQAMARQARGEPSDRSRADAVWLLVEYLRQYDRLAQEAIDRMNTAVFVDLGPDHGVGGFVERNGDEVVFHCRGGSVRLTLDELLARDGVQFRITRRFLANGAKPANDLILAAVHLAHRVDESGGFDADGVRARAAARDHLATASAATEGIVASHARLFLKLVDG